MSFKFILLWNPVQTDCTLIALKTNWKEQQEKPWWAENQHPCLTEPLAMLTWKIKTDRASSKQTSRDNLAKMEHTALINRANYGVVNFTTGCIFLSDSIADSSTKAHNTVFFKNKLYKTTSIYRNKSMSLLNEWVCNQTCLYTANNVKGCHSLSLHSS